MLRKIGRSRRLARARASGPHGYHSTGLPACWRRYGLVSPASRLGISVTASAVWLRGRFLEGNALEIRSALNETRQAKAPLGARIERAQDAARIERPRRRDYRRLLLGRGSE